ncbi:MAG: hypothetical protein MJK15_00650 [Colwellia sp.]|nr:hypothetical protein [Colwellia sp.]
MSSTKVIPCAGCQNKVDVDINHQGQILCHDCQMKGRSIDSPADFVCSSCRLRFSIDLMWQESRTCLECNELPVLAKDEPIVDEPIIDEASLNGSTPAHPFFDDCISTHQPEIFYGMTKREEFVKAALTGMLSNPETWDLDEDSIARIVVSQADAVLKELSNAK